MPYKGTDRNAYGYAKRYGKSKSQRSKLYYKRKKENAARKKKSDSGISLWNIFCSSPRKSHFSKRPSTKKSRPKQKPAPVTKSKSALPTKHNYPTNVVRSDYKRPIFASSRKIAKRKKTAIEKLRNQILSKILDKVIDEATKFAIKAALSSLLPIDLDKAEQMYTYIKVGHKVYKILVKIEKGLRKTEIEAAYYHTDSSSKDYRKFYNRNYLAIVKHPSQINKEVQRTFEFNCPKCGMRSRDDIEVRDDEIVCKLCGSMMVIKPSPSSEELGNLKKMLASLAID